MANFWQIATSIDTAGVRSNTQKIARESKLQRKELEKQTELLRKSVLSSEQIAAEENAKTARQSIWTVVACAIIFLGACLAYPIFGIIVVGIIIVCVIRNKKKKRALEGKNQTLKEKQVTEQAQEAQQSQMQTGAEQSGSSID